MTNLSDLPDAGEWHEPTALVFGKGASLEPDCWLSRPESKHLHLKMKPGYTLTVEYVEEP